MFKLFIAAAILVCANAYYNHGGLQHQPYYGNYDHEIVGAAPIAAASIIPVNSHHGNIYGHGYGSHLGGVESHAKVIEATYPGAVHKTSNYPIANTGDYSAFLYSHNSINNPASTATYLHAPTPIHSHQNIPHSHAGPVAISPSVAYNHASLGNYAHSRYAVNEGPTSYAAHSRYSINGSPALAYGHAHYPVGIAASGIQKIGYNPIVSHMGFQNHAAQSYAW